MKFAVSSHSKPLILRMPFTGLVNTSCNVYLTSYSSASSSIHQPLAMKCLNKFSDICPSPSTFNRGPWRTSLTSLSSSTYLYALMWPMYRRCFSSTSISLHNSSTKLCKRDVFNLPWSMQSCKKSKRQLPPVWVSVLSGGTSEINIRLLPCNSTFVPPWVWTRDLTTEEASSKTTRPECTDAQVPSEKKRVFKDHLEIYQICLTSTWALTSVRIS